MSLSYFFRLLPYFKGKNHLGMWLFKKRMYQKINESITCSYGLKYQIINTSDSIGRELFLNGIYEKETIRLLRKLLAPGKIMIDAGANIGSISLPLAKLTGAHLYAFEPAPLIFQILEKNIQQNHLDNIDSFQLALSDLAGERDFYESERVHGWSGMVGIDSFKKSRVQATRLDDFCKERGIEAIEVLKIDVQGWEYHVLHGAEKLLDEGRIAHIIFEFEWWAEQNAGLNIGAAQELLLQKGYELNEFNGKKISEPVKTGTLLIHAKRSCSPLYST